MENLDVYGEKTEQLDVSIPLFLLVKTEPSDPFLNTVEIGLVDDEGKPVTYLPDGATEEEPLIERIPVEKTGQRTEAVMRHLVMRLVLPEGRYTLQAWVKNVVMWTWPVQITYRGKTPPASREVRYGRPGSDRPKR